MTNGLQLAEQGKEHLSVWKNPRSQEEATTRGKSALTATVFCQAVYKAITIVSVNKQQ